MFKHYLWALVESGSTIITQFIALIILSKILTPSDYGIIGMMSIFIGISNVLIDSGLGGALIKKREIDNKDLSTLFTFNTSVSTILYILLFSISSQIADFYHTPELVLCLKVYSLFIIISSLGIVQITILNKHLKFKTLAVINVISCIFSLIFAICAAYNGLQYWSLIIQQLTYISVRTTSLYIVNKYIPRFGFDLSRFKEQFKFGGYILGSNVIHQIYSNIISSIIPKISTVEQNGYYVQASKIQNVPVNIIMFLSDRVVFPVLSKSEDDQDLIKKARKMFLLITFSTFSIFLILILISKFIVILLLGEKWLVSADYLQILLLAGFGLTYQYLCRNLLKSLAYTSAIFKLELIKSILGILIILTSSAWGLYGILIGFVISSVVNSIITSIYVAKITPYKLSMQIYDLRFAIIPIILSLTFFVIR